MFIYGSVANKTQMENLLSKNTRKPIIDGKTADPAPPSSNLMFGENWEGAEVSLSSPHTDTTCMDSILEWSPHSSRSNCSNSEMAIKEDKIPNIQPPHELDEN